MSVKREYNLEDKVFKSSWHTITMHVCVTADVERLSDGILKYGSTYSIDNTPLIKKLLDIFCDFDIPSTLFVLGQYVEEEPDIYDMIRENGQEVASHGYSHVDLRTLPVSAVKSELSKCTALFSAKGFRAPYYGLNKDVITQVDPYFMYDSSQMPIRNTNRMDKLLQIYMLTESLMEIPISTVGFLPLASMILRLGPLIWIKVLTSLVLSRDGYLIVNVHPWEFFKIPQEVPIPLYVKKNTGPHFLKKFSEFLTFVKTLDVEFTTMEQLYEHYRY